jgi:hypothetical protein
LTGLGLAGLTVADPCVSEDQLFVVDRVVPEDTICEMSLISEKDAF